MMFYSGSHELYGRFVLNGSAHDACSAWRESQSFADELHRRDAECWLERVAKSDGSEIELYEAERSSYSIVEYREAFVDFLAGHALRGEAFLQHIENGFHIIRWTAADLKVSKDKRSGRRRMATMPEGTRAEVRFREASARQHRERESRSPAERFREILDRDGQSMRAVFLHGGDEALRRRAAEAVRQAMGTGSWCELAPDGSNLASCPSDSVIFVPEVEALPLQVQTSLKDRLREGVLRLILATGADPNELLIGQRLSAALYYFVSPGLLDLRDAHP
jgi:hypothetical protein